MWAFEGVGHEKTKNGIPFHGEPVLIDDTFLNGKISVNNHPFIELLYICKDCTRGVCVDSNACFILGTDESGLQKHIETLIRINNLAIEGKPDDLVINTHICRGNFHRSGGFEPLQYVGKDKKVVLGLITTKSPELEEKEYIINRIHEAAKYIPLDSLFLSPQCGFASTEEGNKLTEEEQWKKLRLAQEIAKEVWGK